MMSSHTEVNDKQHSNSCEEGYRRAVELMRECRTEHGFLATPTDQDNYRRIWGRDGAIIGLAALLRGDSELIEGCRQTLETLAQYQGPHGEIPSNVDPKTDRVSYGGTAGRVDADLWFAIGCGLYWRVTGDNAFLDQMLEPLEKVRFLLGTWEFNTRGLLYVPPTGDWADEYLQSGYVLYDQLLYLQAQASQSVASPSWRSDTSQASIRRIGWNRTAGPGAFRNICIAGNTPRGEPVPWDGVRPRP